jgi:hypothetical protein
MNEQEIITDEQLNEVWGNANFGAVSKRDLVKETLLKCLAEYESGHTAKCIVRELGLVHIHKWKLTKLGCKYLFAACFKK